MYEKMYDKIIIGAGIYGLYSALYLGKKGFNVLVLECDKEAFSRATYINQARVHQGYHYPRSISTAMKSAKYFDRFNNDYSFCINKEFEQVYATSSEYSWSSATQFKDFCKAANIPCKEVAPENYFIKNLCDGAFITKEYTYDAMILKDYFIDEISKLKNVNIEYETKIEKIYQDSDFYYLETKINNEVVLLKSKFVLNSTYASTNQILNKLDYEPFKIKYELCEIILCDVTNNFKNIGFTVMDGPFFSIMPFGKSGFHSLTSVSFTPHETSRDITPEFDCQKLAGDFCSKDHLGNCNLCKYKPKTAFPYMANLAKKYLKEEYGFKYNKSLYSMKPILKSSEIDDSRPTVIKEYSKNPTFISVLSGKINTVYDLDEVLDD